jgi:hypothetical protein
MWCIFNKRINSFDIDGSPWRLGVLSESRLRRGERAGEKLFHNNP